MRSRVIWPLLLFCTVGTLAAAQAWVSFDGTQEPMEFRGHNT